MPIDVDAIKAKLQEAFDAVAGDDGKISADDLKKVLVDAGLKPTDDQCAELLAAADKDGSGSLNFEEFAEAVIAVGIRILIAALVRAAFEALDVDNTGLISKDNVRTVVENVNVGDKVTDEMIDNVFEAADTSGDGQISFEEFVNALVELVEDE